MVFQRLWSFVQRHRRKLIFGGIAIAGGSYVAYKVLLPKLQDYLLQRLLKSLGKELAAGAEDGGLPGAADFAHRQQVSDSYAKQSLATLRARHNDCFAIEACTEQLKKATTPEEKADCFKLLQVECLAKAASSLYTLHLQLLLRRLQFNALPATVSSSEGDESKAPSSAHASFLECGGYFQDRGLDAITDSLRRAAVSCCQRNDLSPRSSVSAESLGRLLVEILREADVEILEAARGAVVLLPDCVGQEVADGDKEEVKRLLDEVRDYLDSPQALEVFKAVTASAAAQVSAQLEREGDATAPAGPLSGGKSVVLAKLFGALIELSNQVLSDEGSAPFVERFSAEPVVKSFCEGIYFQEPGVVA